MLIIAMHVLIHSECHNINPLVRDCAKNFRNIKCQLAIKGGSRNFCDKFPNFLLGARSGDMAPSYDIFKNHAFCD